MAVVRQVNSFGQKGRGCICDLALDRAVPVGGRGEQDLLRVDFDDHAPTPA